MRFGYLVIAGVAGFALFSYVASLRGARHGGLDRAPEGPAVPPDATEPAAATVDPTLIDPPIVDRTPLQRRTARGPDATDVQPWAHPPSPPAVPGTQPEDPANQASESK